MLDGPESLAELRGRLEAGGVEVADADGGLLAADPWGNRVLFEGLASSGERGSEAI